MKNLSTALYLYLLIASVFISTSAWAVDFNLMCSDGTYAEVRGAMNVTLSHSAISYKKNGIPTTAWVPRNGSCQLENINKGIRLICTTEENGREDEVIGKAVRVAPYYISLDRYNNPMTATFRRAQCQMGNISI